MQISPVGISFQPYIYNTNMVSANSMNKIACIEADALKSSIDYNQDKNENPLKVGETSNFGELLAMQLQLGKNHATRIMKTTEDVEYNMGKQLITPVIQRESAMPNMIEDADQNIDIQSIDLTETTANDTFNVYNEMEERKLKEDLFLTNGTKSNDKIKYSSEEKGNLFLMKKAIEAYTTSLAI